MGNLERKISSKNLQDCRFLSCEARPEGLKTTDGFRPNAHVLRVHSAFSSIFRSTLPHNLASPKILTTRASALKLQIFIY
jgi:hypothetical protein